MTLLLGVLGFVGPWQIAIIVVLVILLFGGKKIPELMKGMGQGLQEFKKATGKEEPKNIEEKKDDTDAKKE